MNESPLAPSVKNIGKDASVRLIQRVQLLSYRELGTNRILDLVHMSKVSY
jgi:hypothetical protein